MGKHIYVCFINFCNAFDIIDRHVLLVKLMLIKTGWSERVFFIEKFILKTYFRIKHYGLTNNHVHK